MEAGDLIKAFGLWFSELACGLTYIPDNVRDCKVTGPIARWYLLPGQPETLNNCSTRHVGLVQVDVFVTAAPHCDGGATGPIDAFEQAACIRGSAQCQGKIEFVDDDGNEMTIYLRGFRARGPWQLPRIYPAEQRDAHRVVRVDIPYTVISCKECKK